MNIFQKISDKIAKESKFFSNVFRYGSPDLWRIKIYYLLWRAGRIRMIVGPIKKRGYIKFCGYKIFLADESSLYSCLEIICNETYGRPEDFEGAKTIVDFGANIGVFSFWCAVANKSAKIYAYELVPAVFKFLDKNIKLNNLNNVNVFNYGVWSEDGEVTIEQPKEYGVSNVFERSSDGKGISCRLKKARSIIGRFEKIDVLKIDIEGSEYEVLFSLDDKDFAKIKKIIMEFHSMGDSSRPGKLLSFLKDKGFAVQRADDLKEEAGMLFLTNDNCRV